METKITLSEAQGLALGKLRALVGNKQVDLILPQGPDVIRAHLDAFMKFESTLIEKVHDHWHRLFLLGILLYPMKNQGLAPLS